MRLRVMRRAGFAGERALGRNQSRVARDPGQSCCRKPDLHDDIATCRKRRCCWSPMNSSMRCRSGNSSTAASAMSSSPPVVSPSTATAQSSSNRRLAKKLRNYCANTLLPMAAPRSSIDYGYAGGEQGDTLQAVRAAHRFAYVLDHPGEQDLTAHVDFAALAEAAARRREGQPRRQPGTWLETLGIARARNGLGGQNPADTESISAARVGGCATRGKWGACSR